MNDPKRVFVAEKMLEVRADLRSILGDEYGAKLEPYRATLRRMMVQTGKDEIGAVIEFKKRADAKGTPLTSITGCYLTAAAVEEIEANSIERDICGELHPAPTKGTL